MTSLPGPKSTVASITAPAAGYRLCRDGDGFSGDQGSPGPESGSHPWRRLAETSHHRVATILRPPM